MSQRSALLLSDNTEFVPGVNVSFGALQCSIDIAGERQVWAGSVGARRPGEGLKQGGKREFAANARSRARDAEPDIH